MLHNSSMVYRRPEDEASRIQIDQSVTARERVPARAPFVRRVATVLIMTALTGLVLALFVLGIEILLAAFAGVLLAVFLRTCTDVIKRGTHLSDGWSLTTAIVGILILLGVVGWLLGPTIAEQSVQLGEQLPDMLEHIEGFLQESPWGQWILDQAQNGGLEQGATERVGQVFSSFSAWFSYVLTAVFVGLFAAANPLLYQEGIAHLFPLRQRARIRALMSDLSYTLRWWLLGQALAMLVIGVSTTIVLWLFDIPLAIVIGIIVGLLGFIPYLGPIFGAVPVALFAATEGTVQLFYVMLAYAAVQILEGYVATPVIQHRTVYLPPVFTLITQILLGSVLGLLGFVLATPLAAVLLVLTRYYRSDILGDEEAQNDDGGN